MNNSTTSAPKACDLLIRAEVVVTQDDSRSIFHEAGVAVCDGLVAEVGSYADLDASYKPTSRLDMSGNYSCPDW